MITLSIAPFHLLFREPFGTAHGLRKGTDSVFVRLERNGVVGHGEATLPPYVKETQASVLQLLGSPELKIALAQNGAGLAELLATARWRAAPGARAAVQCAYNELFNKELGSLNSSGSDGLGTARCMVTLGSGEPGAYASRIAALPAGFPVLKVKLGGPFDLAILRRVCEHDDRPLLLDANQGWRSVDQAVLALNVAGADRVIALEQPFPKDRWDLHAALSKRTKALVIADESIQGPEDLERAPGVFGGVNLKLMKCGGLDVAQAMAERARQLGLQVMLGSMSESSLGCAAMLSLAGSADLLDLDGPWLLSNDPFEGMALHEGRLQTEHKEAGYGVRERIPSLLDWHPVGA
jgi:L-Ala-D/L-Glu epimerase